MDTSSLISDLISIFLVACLEVALSADNTTALMSTTNTHSLKNQKKLIRWALIWGSPLNFVLIFVVIYLHDIPSITNYVHLALGLALLWVARNGWKELSSNEDEKEAAVEEVNHVEIPIKQFAKIILQLQVQSIPFYFDSVPLASSISHSVIIISCGIMLSRAIMIINNDPIVEFLSTHKNVQWGVILFIAFSALEDLSLVVSNTTQLFSAIDLDITGEISLLVGSLLLGLATAKYIIAPDPVTEETKLINE
jgi:predicted tellurium resistance membrane protein TerC